MTRNPALPAISVHDPIKVALLTDDPLLRAGLSSLLTQNGDISVVEADAEVALWDAGVDSERTLARLGEIRALPMPTVAVVGDGAHVAPALAAGARGVVLRDQVGPGIHAALAAVRSGLTVMDTSLAASLVPPPPTPTPNKGRGELTERERQVVQLLSEGLSNKLVADRLGISDHTAKFHVNGVMMKLVYADRSCRRSDAEGLGQVVAGRLLRRPIASLLLRFRCSRPPGRCAPVLAAPRARASSLRVPDRERPAGRASVSQPNRVRSMRPRSPTVTPSRSSSSRCMAAPTGSWIAIRPRVLPAFPITRCHGNGAPCLREAAPMRPPFGMPASSATWP
jgi:DNA-binding NarL/FixJ family response regulator